MDVAQNLVFTSYYFYIRMLTESGILLKNNSVVIYAKMFHGSYVVQKKIC